MQSYVADHLVRYLGHRWSSMVTCIRFLRILPVVGDDSDGVLMVVSRGVFA